MKKNLFNQEVELYENISLKKYNTYHVECICKYLIFPKNVDELVNVIEICKKNNIKYLVLGNGSNIILKNKIFNGAIIKLDRLNQVKYNGNKIDVEAGYSLIKLSLETISKGLSGLEFASGIPGQVGASAAMNAGAYNESMSNVVTSVKVLTPELKIIELSNKELDYKYRDSFLKANPGYIVLSVTLSLSKGNSEKMKKDIDEKRQRRLSTQPLDKPSAGSVFRNPDGNYAGALIEKLNLKGHRIGGAEVSTKHANFIINAGTATGKEIVKLIEKIQKEVKKNFNIELKLEQIIID